MMCKISYFRGFGVLGFWGFLIVLKGTVSNLLELIWGSAFSNISVVVSNHLVEESFGLISGCHLHAAGLDSLDNFHALVVKFTFDLLLVAHQPLVELGILWVLLDGGDGPDGSSL